MNTTDLYLPDVNVKLDKLTPRTLDCVPCDLKLMNDNPDSGSPHIKKFPLAPHDKQFIDLLLQRPNGREFWILHTIPKQKQAVPAMGYRMVVKATAANSSPTYRTLELIKNGPEWSMKAVD